MEHEWTNSWRYLVSDCDPCEYCLGDGCEDCLDPPEPDYEAIAEYHAARDWDRGEAVRWGGLDIPS